MVYSSREEAKLLILNYLKSHCKSKNEAIKGSALQTLFGYHGSVIRAAVNELRFSGHPICSGTKGYWYSNDVDDILDTRANLESRVLNIMNAIDGLDRCLRKIEGEIDDAESGREF